MSFASKIKAHYKVESGDIIPFKARKKFTANELAKLRVEYSKINGIDPCSNGYDSMVELLDGMDKETLQQVADADIKFLSKLAINRLSGR